MTRWRDDETEQREGKLIRQVKYDDDDVVVDDDDDDDDDGGGDDDDDDDDDDDEREREVEVQRHVSSLAYHTYFIRSKSSTSRQAMARMHAPFWSGR